jgi:phage baseplate assembly protein W
MLYVTKGLSGVDTGEAITMVDAAYEDAANGANVIIDAFVHETDVLLPNQVVSAYLDWNDGGATVLFPKIVGGLLHVSATRFLAPGQYVIRLNAQNYRSPLQNKVAVNYFVTVTSTTPVSNPQKYIFGPILPRDSGFPNVNQWEFQLDSDQLILESSVKMLLLTSKGERVMEPNYGTNIRRILFELQIAGIDSLLQDEIVSALALWEPRVELQSLTLQRDQNNRNVCMNLVLISKLSKQAFETSVEYVR